MNLIQKQNGSIKPNKILTIEKIITTVVINGNFMGLHQTIIGEILVLQSEQVSAIDIYAELADPLDLEIKAIRFQRKNLAAIQDHEIARLTKLQRNLEASALKLNEAGQIGLETVVRSEQKQTSYLDLGPKQKLRANPTSRKLSKPGKSVFLSVAPLSNANGKYKTRSQPQKWSSLKKQTSHS
ncbi:hypothetical protein ACQ4M3_20495 [Leptolyngbya sp. AN03gr2]|uniref:hypothetical protein n=1 Tax=unclassified Leptolyngbya TaxID=2650499 RepID=UPI003D31B301